MSFCRDYASQAVGPVSFCSSAWGAFNTITLPLPAPPLTLVVGLNIISEQEQNNSKELN